MLYFIVTKAGKNYFQKKKPGTDNYVLMLYFIANKVCTITFRRNKS